MFVTNVLILSQHAKYTIFLLEILSLIKTYYFYKILITSMMEERNKKTRTLRNNNPCQQIRNIFKDNTRIQLDSQFMPEGVI